MRYPRAAEISGFRSHSGSHPVRTLSLLRSVDELLKGFDGQLLGHFRSGRPTPNPAQVQGAFAECVQNARYGVDVGRVKGALLVHGFDRNGRNTRSALVHGTFRRRSDGSRCLTAFIVRPLSLEETAQKQQNNTDRTEQPTTIAVFRSYRAAHGSASLALESLPRCSRPGFSALCNAPEKQRQIRHRQILIPVVAHS